MKLDGFLHSELKEKEESEGFVILEVEMRNFMCYLDKAVIKFPHKFTVITGRTGSGKTSILDAITFALYKSTSRTDIKGIKIEDICKPNGYVKTTFKQAKNTYEVQRGLAANSAPYLILKKDGRRIEGKIPELDKIIEEIVGLDYVGFINSTFVRQEEMKQLGAETGSQRLEIFQKLFRLEIFEKAQEIAEKKFREIELKIVKSEEKLKSEQMWFEEIKMSLPKKQKEIQILMAQISEKEKEEKNLNNIIKCREEEFKLIQLKHEEYLKLGNQFSEAKKLAEEIKNKLLSAQQAQRSVEQLKNKIKELQEETKDYDNLMAEKESLEKLGRQIEDLQKEMQRSEREKKNIEEVFEQDKKLFLRRIEKEENRIKNLKTEITKEEAFELLRQEGALGERLQRIAKELEWLAGKEIVQHLEEEREISKKELLKISEKVKKINVDSFILSEIREQIKQIQKDLQDREAKYRSSIKEIENNISEIQEKIKKLNFDEVYFNKILNSAAKKEKQKRELENCWSKLNEIGDASKLIEELAQQLREQKRKSEALQIEVAALEEVEKKYKDAKIELESLKNKYAELKSEIANLNGIKATQQKVLQEEESKLKELEERIKNLEKELLGFRKNSEVLAILKEKIFHKKGIVMYAINQLLPQLAIETSENLAELTDRRFSKVRLVPYEENNRYGIRIEVEGSDGLFHDVQEFSGGEKTQINAALRFAIAKELASMPQVGRSYGRMKTLFIDEGDLGSLDTDVSRELFVKKLFDIGKFFEKVILITHLSEVAEKFPGKIQVYTVEEKSRVEVL